MLELIYPGVYMDESTSGARPISGVPASTDGLLALVNEWVRAVRVHMPEWTGGADGDPGVTLIELFAFLADSAVFRSNEMPQRARVAAARLARSLDALARGIPPVKPLQRPNYFRGRLLDPPTRTITVRSSGAFFGSSSDPASFPPRRQCG